MAHPTRCLGLILVNPTFTTAEPMKHIKAVVQDTLKAKEAAIKRAMEKYQDDFDEEYELKKHWERFMKDREAAIKNNSEDVFKELNAEINPKCDYIVRWYNLEAKGYIMFHAGISAGLLTRSSLGLTSRRS